jgi:hypothetical protein
MPATQEAEIRKSTVQSQPGQTVLEILSWKKPISKKQKRDSGVAWSVDPEFTSHFFKKDQILYIPTIFLNHMLAFVSKVIFGHRHTNITPQSPVSESCLNTAKSSGFSYIRPQLFFFYMKFW